MSRFLLACRRQPVDRTPVWFMRQAGRSQPEYRALRERYSLLELCRHSDLVAEITLAPVARLGVDAMILFADITVPLLGMGVAFDLREGSGPHIHRPVRSTADLEALHPFEPEATVQALLEAIRLVRRSASAPLIGFAGAPFTLASYLIEGGPSREFLHTKALMRGNRPLWDGLMTRLTEAAASFLLAQIACGAQAVQLFDSWVGALSPREYGAYVAPYSRRIFEAVGETGVPSIHFGTGTAGLLREMAAAGGDVIGVDWRIGLDAAWAQIGYDRAVQGNLDPSVLLAPPEVLRAEAEAVLDRAAGRPGHIFNLGHGVLPETPQGRLRDLVELVHAYRPAEVGA